METETPFRIITLILVSTGMTVSIYHRRKAELLAAKRGENISRREEGKTLLIILRLGGLVLWSTILGYVINPNWLSWASLPMPLWLRWAGVAIALIAWALLIWMFKSLGDNITDTVVTRKQHSLVVHGPYRWIQHPLYSFGTLFFFGLSLITAKWILVLFTILAFVLLSLRTPIEEARLAERFGEEYRQYSRRTGRFFPKFRLGLPGSQKEDSRI
jgi:protein-S-isoprenylcysteine O-methyltransferase Ste14